MGWMKEESLRYGCPGIRVINQGLIIARFYHEGRI